MENSYKLVLPMITAPASFRRVFSLGHLILFGVTFVGPTAPFPMFGSVSSASKGHMALAYLIVMVVMMLTAFSYGRMASAFPEAGSAHAYAGKALHPLAGIVAGWTVLLDYLLPPRIFAYIHPKYSTPTYGILAMGVVTLLGGFPFPICTPSHGSAYDIAGKGIANLGASKAAVLLAAKMVRRTMERAAA